MVELPTGAVTFLFTDIEGSTRLWEQEPQAMQAALARHDALLRQAIESHGGHVFKTIGDAFCAVFDRPDEAVTAAIAAQHALSEEKLPLRVRMAVHGGAAENREGDYFGPALNRVARLLAAGHGGQVLLSASTAAQLPPERLAEIDLRSLGVHRLRDIAAREAIFQLLAPGLPTRFPPLNTLDVAFRRGVVRAAGVAMVILAVVSSLAVVAVRQSHRAEQQRRLANAQRSLAEARERTGRHYLYASQMKLAQQSWEEGKAGDAQALLEAWRPQPGDEDLRGFEWRYLWRLCQADAPFTLRGPGLPVEAVAFSPDGKTLAASSDDRTIRLWDVATRQVVATLKGHKDAVNAVAFSPDGKMIASGSADKTVKLWERERSNAKGSHREIATLGASGGGWNALAFSPDRRLLAYSSSGSTVRLWEIASRRPLAALKGLAGEAWSVEFSRDGKMLATGSQEGLVQLWQLPSRQPIAALRGHTAGVTRLAFSPDGKILATGSADNTAILWDLATKREVTHLVGHGDAINSVVFSPNGKSLATASGDRTIRLWDLATKQTVNILRGHKHPVTSVAFSPDGQILASGSVDNTVKLWNPATREDATTVVRQKSHIGVLAFSPDGQVLATGSGDRTVRLWDAGGGRELATLRGHNAPVGSLAFSPDGKTLASGSDDHTVRLWDVASRRTVATLNGFKGGNWAVAFSPNGQTLAMQGSDAVKLWDLATKRVSASFEWDPRMGWGLAFSPDGKTLAALRASGTIALWDLATKRAVGSVPGIASAPLLFSADGKRLATGSSEGMKLWDLATRRPVASARRPGEGDAALSPDGKTLALASASAILLSNLTINQEVATLKGDTGTVTTVAFSSDGNTLASGSADGTVRLWRAASLSEADLPHPVASVGDRWVQLQWQPVPSAQGYHIYRGPIGAVTSQLVRLTPRPVIGDAFADRGSELANGKPQVYGVAAVFPRGAGKSIEGPRATLQTTPMAVPPGWMASSINEDPAVGSVAFDAATGEITLRGSGDDIYYAADGCYFLNRLVTGDFQMTVRLRAGPTAANEWAKAGVMVRDSLAAGARHVSLLNTATHGLHYERRPIANDATDTDTAFERAAPKRAVTLRLTRRGDTVTAAYSRDDGKSFQVIGAPYPFDQPLPRTLYAGLAVTAHDASRVSEARFSGLEIRSR